MSSRVKENVINKDSNRRNSQNLSLPKKRKNKRKFMKEKNPDGQICGSDGSKR